MHENNLTGCNVKTFVLHIMQSIPSTSSKIEDIHEMSGRGLINLEYDENHILRTFFIYNTFHTRCYCCSISHKVIQIIKAEECSHVNQYNTVRPFILT